MKRLILLFACLSTLLMTQPSLAADKVDFTGTWELDLDASDSVEAIMKAQGRSWAERKIADNLVVTQTITQSAETMVVEVTSTVKDKREVLKLDGSEEVKKTDDAGSVVSRTFWQAGGTQLVTENIMTLADGAKVNMVLTRFLEEEGKVMRQDISLKLSDGQVLTARRVLRQK